MSAVLYDIPGPRARRRALIGTILGGVALLAIIGLVGWKLAQKNQLDPVMWSWVLDPGVQRRLVEGLLNTVKAAVLSIVFALVVGALLATARLSDHRWVRVPATVIIEFFRAIPLLLLILFGFFAYGKELAFIGEAVAATPAAQFAAIVVGLTLYNGSVLAEVFRAGIHAVSRGQSEAAYAIGMRKNQVMRLILMPQAVRIMLPAIVSQCVVALKDSALGFVIGYDELLNVGKNIYRSTQELQLPRAPIIQVIVIVGGIFIVLNLLLGWLAKVLERRMSRSKTLAVDTAALDVEAAAAPGAGDAAVLPPDVGGPPTDK